MRHLPCQRRKNPGKNQGGIGSLTQNYSEKRSDGIIHIIEEGFNFEKFHVL